MGLGSGLGLGLEYPHHLGVLAEGAECDTDTLLEGGGDEAEDQLEELLVRVRREAWAWAWSWSWVWAWGLGLGLGAWG